MMIRALRKLLAAVRLADDRSGTAIVEFATLLPVLLTLFIGSFETANLLLAYMKLQAAAEETADLVAQTSPTDPANPGNPYVLQVSDFTNITGAAQRVMTPLPTGGLKVAYASVTFTGTNGAAQINWHDEENGAAAITIGSLPSGVTAASLGPISCTSGASSTCTQVTGSTLTDSFIVVRLTYPYVSPVSHVLSTNWTLTEAAFTRPRYVTCVPSYHNANSFNGFNICP